MRMTGTARVQTFAMKTVSRISFHIHVAYSCRHKKRESSQSLDIIYSIIGHWLTPVGYCNSMQDSAKTGPRLSYINDYWYQTSINSKHLFHIYLNHRCKYSTWMACGISECRPTHSAIYAFIFLRWNRRIAGKIHFVAVVKKKYIKYRESC